MIPIAYIVKNILKEIEMENTNQNKLYVRLKEPTQCHLWQKETLTIDDVIPVDNFDTVSTLFESSHLDRLILKCKQCGQLYFYETYEVVNYDRDDDIYSCFIPIEIDDVSKLDGRTPIELLGAVPRLQWDGWDNIRWIGKPKPDRPLPNSGNREAEGVSSLRPEGVNGSNEMANSSIPNNSESTQEGKSQEIEYVRNSEGRVFYIGPKIKKYFRVLMAMGWMDFRGSLEDMSKGFKALTKGEISALPPDNFEESLEDMINLMLTQVQDSMGFARLKDGRIVYLVPLSRKEWATVSNSDGPWKLFDGDLEDLMDAKPLSAEEVISMLPGEISRN